MSLSRYPVTRIVGLSAFLLACLVGSFLLFGDWEIARSEFGEQRSDARSVPDARSRGGALLTAQELAEVSVVGSRSEVQAQAQVILAESALMVSTTEIGTYSLLLDSIRKAAEGDEPHHAAWPHVQALTNMVTDDLSGAELPAVRLGLDAVLRASATESEFVRAAVLMALGMALPKIEAEGLANEFVLGTPGELARSAWFILAVRQLTAGSDPGGVDLGMFTRFDSQVSLETWPIVIPYPEDSSLMELGLRQLTSARIDRESKNDDSPKSSLLLRQKMAGWEVIVLTAFAVRAQKPGQARDMLLQWMWDSDMRRVCIWSLCLAAKSDRELAATLRDHLLSLGVNSDAGKYLAGQLGGLAGRGDLVFEMLQAELLGPSESEGLLKQYKDAHAVFALGEMLASGQEELGEQATELLIEVASSPTVLDSVRTLALVELANARPDRIGDGIELVLISEAGGGPRQVAALLARTVQVGDQQRMRDLLIASYSWGEVNSDIHEAYVISLMFFGGADSDSFLRGVPLGDIVDPTLARSLELYLSR